jgi:hypothetical protein
LDEQLGLMRVSLANAAQPGTAPQLADAIIDAVGRGIVFTAPADPAASAEYLSRVKLSDVDAAFRAAWQGGGRRIFVSHNQEVVGGEAAVTRSGNEAGSLDFSAAIGFRSAQETGLRPRSFWPWADAASSAWSGMPQGSYRSRTSMGPERSRDEHEGLNNASSRRRA